MVNQKLQNIKIGRIEKKGVGKFELLQKLRYNWIRRNTTWDKENKKLKLMFFTQPYTKEEATNTVLQS